LGDLTDLRPEYFEGSEVNKLYTEEFLSLLGSRLNPSGKAVYHVGGLNMDTKLIGLFWRRVRKVFRHVRAYGVYIPSFLDIWVYIAMSNNEFGLSREDPPIIELSYCDKDHIHTPICYLKK
jgi:spermidine synthase